MYTARGTAVRFVVDVVIGALDNEARDREATLHIFEKKLVDCQILEIIYAARGDITNPV